MIEFIMKQWLIGDQNKRRKSKCERMRKEEKSITKVRVTMLNPIKIEPKMAKRKMY